MPFHLRRSSSPLKHHRGNKCSYKLLFAIVGVGGLFQSRTVQSFVTSSTSAAHLTRTARSLSRRMSNANGASSTTQQSATLPAPHKLNDVLFESIEDHQLTQKEQPFGRILDAGTGNHSLRWIGSLISRSSRAGNDGDDDGNDRMDDGTDTGVTSFTAITADETMRRNVVKEAERLGIATCGEVVIGNWATTADEPTTSTLCKDQVYDTILADYLLGSVDGFAPFFQDRMFGRLKQHLKTDGTGRMYVVGLEPLPDSVGGPGDIIAKVRSVRDACILLARHRCYREYPVTWIQRNLKQHGFIVETTTKFPIVYSHGTILRQINVARSKLPLFDCRDTAASMGKQLDRLEEESKMVVEENGGRITLGFDYIVAARLPQD